MVNRKLPKNYGKTFATPRRPFEKARLDQILGNDEIKAAQLENLQAASTTLSGDMNKMEAIVVKTPALQRKIKQLQTDIAVVEEVLQTLR